MKKLFKLAFLFVLLCMPCIVLGAEVCYDPQDVIENIPKTYYMQLFNEDGDSIIINNDKTNKVLKFTEAGADELMAVHYDDCHFTFTNTTDPEFFASFVQTIIFASIQSAIFETAGHHNYSIDIDTPTVLDAEVYGVTVDLDEIVIDEEDSHIEFDYLNSFDLELSKTKIEKLYTDYGYYLMPDVAPRLEGKSATETTIDIQLSLPEDYSADYYNCELYISKDAGSSYTKYTTTRCDSKVTIQGLEAGKKYLFKSNIVDDRYESDVLEFSTTVAPQSGKENPNTGSNISMFIVPGLLLIGLIGVVLSNNKKSFKDI